jgi:hypothetical protein
MKRLLRISRSLSSMFSLEQVGSITSWFSFAHVGLVALGHAGDLEVAHAARWAGTGGSSSPGRLRRSGSGTGRTAPSGWRAHLLHDGVRLVLAVEEEAGMSRVLMGSIST